VPAIFPVSIVTPEQSRMSSAIWNATPRASPKAPGAAGQPARRLEQLPRLQRATFEVRRDARVRIEALRALQRLAPR